jgi:hypothetical protein
MSLRSTLAPLGVAAVVALGVFAALPREATAQKRFACHMKGIWADNPSDVFEFDAAYVYNRGEDDFTGVYTNPGAASANIVGAARNGVWNIVLTYTDSAHANMIKKLIGKGTQDQATHDIIVKGDYHTFLGANDIKKDGQFTLDGKCK